MKKNYGSSFFVALMLLCLLAMSLTGCQSPSATEDTPSSRSTATEKSKSQDATASSLPKNKDEDTSSTKNKNRLSTLF